jgi:hypothetical protein
MVAADFGPIMRSLKTPIVCSAALMLTLASYTSSGSAIPQQILPMAEAPARAASEETISLAVSGMT